MQVLIKRWLTIRCWLFYFVWLVPGYTLGQQNLFNIPSGDITVEGKVFYQHQLNFYSFTEFDSKSHLVFGLGKGWDVGVNLVDVPFRLVRDSTTIRFNDSLGKKPLYPLIMGTIQKQVKLNEKLFLNFGTQAGLNITNRLSNKTFAHFTYSTMKWHFHKGFIIAGPYYTNSAFTGGNQHTMGWMFGYEIPVTKRVSLMGDFISGRHKKSVTTFGVVYDISNRTQLCIGSLLPFPNQELPGGLVIELNVFGWNYKNDH
jgi:hypothetical protein